MRGLVAIGAGALGLWILLRKTKQDELAPVDANEYEDIEYGLLKEAEDRLAGTEHAGKAVRLMMCNWQGPDTMACKLQVEEEGGYWQDVGWVQYESGSVHVEIV
jgi:hypothetical protein